MPGVRPHSLRTGSHQILKISCEVGAVFAPLQMGTQAPFDSIASQMYLKACSLTHFAIILHSEAEGLFPPLNT